MYWLTLIQGLILAIGVSAKTHVFHFNVSYVTANPDGLYERRVIGINDQWPLPTIRVKTNDRVVIHLANRLDVRTSLHFHGLFQKGSNAMDGPEMVTQCPIPPNQTFLYNFTVEDQAGTYWYHSHSGSQYGDGLRGLFIIEDDDVKFDEEVTLSISDWYHKETAEITKGFLSRYNPTGTEPIPQSSLFNDTRDVKWAVKPNTTYLLRIANVGLFVSQYLFIEDHKFTIVEIDGVVVKPKVVDSLYLAVAQRYSVLVHTRDDVSRNFRFVNVLDQEMLDFLPDDLETVSTNWFVYDESNILPARLDSTYEEVLKSLNPADDFDLTPLQEHPLFGDADYKIELNFSMENLGNGVQYALFNGKTYVPPRVPTLMTVQSSKNYANDQHIYGSNTNSFILQSDEIVEIVLNNKDPGKHPFHLHGHNFQVISRSQEGTDDNDPIVYDPNNPDHNKFPEFPMIRDTVMVNPNGFIVLRFKANNPGVWFFHCHVDWHLEQGLAIVLIEAPTEIQNQKLPQNHLDICEAGNMSSIGNAAGRSGHSESEWLDLSGENVQVAPLPDGFTPKGYIAVVVCALFAIYGVFSIYDYGMQDFATEDTNKIVHKVYDIIDRYLPPENASELPLVGSSRNE
ncbi:uncharacterized protein PRCAT00006062001 [Priceomyces carsonii]|uniref:uncharacterized protein n=1 Tax=Priceomyces carsonii TaxID=28549 RepID=UPI002ED9F463|nr:unnamed protein product [Priceomyces carsonii]